MSNRAELWCHLSGATPRDTADDAARLEEAGWDGGILIDSQCFVPECWTVLTLCAERTTTLRLTTGATNPVTRHPSVTASSASTLQLISNGRMGLGVGRGDSALAALGVAPMAIGKFETYLALLQSYLGGEMIPFEKAAAMVADSRHDFEKLVMGKPLPGSGLYWLQQTKQRKVPLEVMVTGPKAIAAAARTADWVILNVGADIERIKWGIERIRATAQEASRNVRIGVYISAVPHPDRAASLRLGMPTARSFGRFSIMNKKVVGPTSEAQQQVLESIAQDYDYTTHGGIGNQPDVITEEFIEQFVVTGSTSRCVERLQKILSVDGVERLNIMPSNPLADEAGTLSCQLLSKTVLPEIRI